MAQARTRGAQDFKWFVFHIFSKSFDEFTGGKYIENVCKHLIENDYTMDVTGRNHFKSTRLYADIMWRLLSEKDDGFEGWYFSYKQELAAYHLGKVKELIRNNPFYNGIIDHKSKAESVLSYTWNMDDPRMIIRPAGLLAFKRGIHADHLYIDDPLQDPASELQPTIIYKINSTIKRSILPMVNRGGTCRIVGTPQTKEDFYFDAKMQKRFKTWITPAITDEAKKQALWPEWMSYSELAAIRETQGTKIFNPEYMAVPVYTENAYIGMETLAPYCVKKCWSFSHHERLLSERIVVAGLDIGKKAHPSHFVIWAKTYHRDNDNDIEYISYEQLYSEWLEHWDYYKQVDHVNMATEYFNISQGRFDNTRGEFEFALEQNIIHRYWQPMTLTAKTESSLAANFSAIVENGYAKFINETRQMNQIVSVNGSLKAIESPEGHGDAFWSNAMALYEDYKAVPRIRAIII